MAENQKTFMLWICEHNLQTFSSSAVTFATADNSIAAFKCGDVFQCYKLISHKILVI